MVMRTSYETALSSVKRFINDEKPTIPTCFISYAWGDAEQERWVLRLARDLKQADLNVILDNWDDDSLRDAPIQTALALHKTFLCTDQLTT